MGGPIDENLKLICSKVHYNSWASYRGFAKKGKSVVEHLVPVLENCVKQGNEKFVKRLGISLEQAAEYKLPEAFIDVLETLVLDVSELSWGEVKLKVGGEHSVVDFIA